MVMEQQSQTGEFLPEKDVAVAATVDVEDMLTKHEEEEEEELNEKNEKYALPAHHKHRNIAIRFLSLGDVQNLPLPYHPLYRLLLLPALTGRGLTIQIFSSPVTESQFKLPAAPPAAYDGSSNRRHQSLQFTPTSVSIKSKSWASDDYDEDGWKEKDAVQRSGVRAGAGRQGKHGVRSRAQAVNISSINIETPSPEATDDNEPTLPSFWSLMPNHPQQTNTFPRFPLLSLQR